MKDSLFSTGDFRLFLGPCVIESYDSALFHAEEIRKLCDRPFVYKSSFSKANRTSKESFRGPGLEEGLKILESVKEKVGVPVITDVHSVEDIKSAAQVVDVLQIPAFLCRQTELLEAAGDTKLPVMIKKGQFLHPSDMKYAAEKVGHDSVMLCERGSCFGYRELVVDFKGLGLMSDFGYPVIFDATHSVQVMGGAGGKSSGARAHVVPLARAAAAYGIDGLFLETHKDPESSPSDGANMLPLSDLASSLKEILRYHELKQG